VNKVYTNIVHKTTTVFLLYRPYATLGYTVITESSKNGTITLSRINVSGYVGHMTICSWMFTTSCCWVRVRVGIRVRIRFSAWLVSGYAHVFMRRSVVIKTWTTHLASISPFYTFITETSLIDLISGLVARWWNYTTLLGGPHHAVCHRDRQSRPLDPPRLALWQCHVPRDRSFAVAAPRAWKNLPSSLRRVHPVNTFERQLKTFLFAQAF